VNHPSSASQSGFQTRRVLAVSLAHFVHDTYTAFLAPLLPLLIQRLQLSLVLAGSLTFFLQVPSLLNPVIGYLDDRLNLRCLVYIAPGLTGTLMSCLGFAGSYWSLAGLLLATGLSVAFFHAPAPALVAQTSGNRVGRGMSLLMAAGELGRTIGPVLVVGAVAWISLEGLYWLAAAGWGASLVLWIQFRSVPRRTPPGSDLRLIVRQAGTFFAPLAVLLMARSLLLVGIQVFLPTFLTSEGSDLWFGAWALTIFEFAGVGGALFAGNLSDHFGRRKVIFWALLFSGFLMLLLVELRGTLLLIALVPFGFVSLASQPVMLALVQDRFPNNRSAASGFFLAISFILRPAAAVSLGAVGDWLGLGAAYYLASLVLLLTLPVIRLLPSKTSTPD